MLITDEIKSRVAFPMYYPKLTHNWPAQYFSIVRTQRRTSGATILLELVLAHGVHCSFQLGFPNCITPSLL